MRTLQRADWLSVLVIASCSAWVLFRWRQKSRTGDANAARGNAVKAAELVCAELGAIDQTWVAVVPEAVVVEGFFGQGSAVGGLHTYRVSATIAEGCVERAVALRQWSIRREVAVEQRLFVQRWCAACRVFAEHGVGPRRLAEQLLSEGRSDGWSIEEWPGTALHTVQPPPGASSTATASWRGLDASTARAAGRLLARAHQVPVAWFDGFRESYEVCLPWLRGIARGSHAWVYASLAPGGLLGCDASLRMLWADGSTAAPRHPASARLVTTHGNFHPRNIVRAAVARAGGTARASGAACDGSSVASVEAEEGEEEEFQLIDFDCSCVTAAIFDLASAFALDESGHFRSFLAGYLDELGDAWSGADLEAIRLDAALASRRIHSGLEAIRLALAEATVHPGRGPATRGREAYWLFGGGGRGRSGEAAEETAAEETATKTVATKAATKMAAAVAASAVAAAAKAAVLAEVAAAEAATAAAAAEAATANFAAAAAAAAEFAAAEAAAAEFAAAEAAWSEAVATVPEAGAAIEEAIAAAVVVAAAEEARAVAERVGAVALTKEELEAAWQVPDHSVDIPQSSAALRESSAAVAFGSTVSAEAAEHLLLGLSPSGSLKSLDSLGSQNTPGPYGRAETKEVNRAARNSVAAQDWAIKRRQQVERAACIKGGRAFTGRSPSTASSTVTPPRSPAVLVVASCIATPKSAQAASHGASPIPRAASRSLNGGLQAAAPTTQPQSQQSPQQSPQQLASRRRSSWPGEGVFAFEEEDTLSSASSSYTSLSSSSASFDDWRTRRQARLAKTASTPSRSPRRVEAQAPPAFQPPSSPLRPGYTCGAAHRSNPYHASVTMAMSPTWPCFLTLTPTRRDLAECAALPVGNVIGMAWPVGLARLRRGSCLCGRSWWQGAVSTVHTLFCCLFQNARYRTCTKTRRYKYGKLPYQALHKNR